MPPRQGIGFQRRYGGMTPDLLAPFAGRDSVCHRWSPAVKLVALAVYLAATFAIPATSWPVLGLLACLAWIGHAVAGIPAGYLLRRLLLVTPFLFAVGVGMLGLRAGLERIGPDRVERFAMLSGRVGVALLGTLWVVNTTALVELVRQLRRWGCPAVFASVLLLAWRYIAVLFDELGRLRTARRSRTLSQQSLWQEWLSLGQCLGQLLIRSLDRAEQIHQAMESRGWSGGTPR
jgi:cobalt/nickel transport system permease protein